MIREKITIEYCKIDVCCVQHKLYRDEQGKQVLAGKESVDSAEHHDGTDDQIVYYVYI